MRTTALFTSVGLAAASAGAGNLDGYFIGNRSALSAGAVTASIRDGEALWYNPAGLIGADVEGLARASIEVGATAFALKIRPMPGLFVTELPDQDVVRDLNDIAFDSVPTSLLFVKQLSPTLSLGFGVVVPIKDRLLGQDNFSEAVKQTGIDEQLYEQRASLDLSRVEYHAGVGVGWAPLPELRIGTSLFVTYSKLQTVASFWAHVNAKTTDPDTGLPEEADGSQLVDLASELGIIGCHLDVGAQWEIGSGLTLGLHVRSPVFVFGTFSSGSTLAIEGFSATGQEGGTAANFDEEAFDPDLLLIRSARLAAGVSYATPKGFVGLDVDLQLPDTGNELGLDSELEWNVRVGGIAHLSPRWSIGGGVFTDRSANRAPATLGDIDVDYYGLALGVELRTSYPLAEKDHAALVMATTLGLRYALGVGQTGSFRYRPYAEVGEPTVIEEPIDVTFHEIALHIGSGFYF